MIKQTLQFTTPRKHSVIKMKIVFYHTMKYNLMLLFLLGPMFLFGQDLASGVEALEEAGDGIAEYFEPIETIVYILAGIMALFGGFMVFTKWQKGDANTIGAAVAWLGSILFLIISITIIKSFFNI